MIVNQAYRFALDPNPAQLAALRSHAGASRKAFNWALGLVKDVESTVRPRSRGWWP